MDKSDFYYRDGGSVVMMIPASDNAKTWTQDHVQLADWQKSSYFAVEEKYFSDLAEGILSDGLTITEI